MKKQTICFRRVNPGYLGHRVLRDRIRQFFSTMRVERWVPGSRGVSTAGSALARIAGQDRIPR